MEGLSGKGRRPPARKLQAREKQKGFQEGPALEVATKRAFQRQGSLPPPPRISIRLEEGRVCRKYKKSHLTKVPAKSLRTNPGASS